MIRGSSVESRPQTARVGANKSGEEGRSHREAAPAGRRIPRPRGSALGQHGEHHGVLQVVQRTHADKAGSSFPPITIYRSPFSFVLKPPPAAAAEARGEDPERIRRAQQEEVGQVTQAQLAEMRS
jgi:ribosomal protein L11